MTDRRVLVRSGKAPHTVVGAEAAAAARGPGVFAGNTGNLLFTNSVHKVLRAPGTTTVSDALATERAGVDDAYIETIDEFDALVIPLANAFRPHWHVALNRLTRVIERLHIPVVVAGVGVQAGLGGDASGLPDQVHTAARRFVRAVLAHSATIGVRGEITADYLVGLGFPASAVQVVGCPSLFDPDCAPRLRLPAAIGPDLRVAHNVTPSVPGSGALLARTVREFADTVYVPQEHRELTYLLWAREIANYPADLPHTIDDPLYRTDRIRMFLDPVRWHEFMAERDVSFGTRIHGNIAALQAGTPAVVLAHDSRTLELCRLHEIPHLVPKGRDLGPVDPVRLLESADFTAYHAALEPNRVRFTDFLAANGLDHVFAHGGADGGYREVLRGIEHAPPVRPLTVVGPEEIAARLRWLWQGEQADDWRDEGAYRPELVPASVGPRSLPAHAAAQEKALAELRTTVATLSAELAEARTGLRALNEQSRQHGRALAQLRAPWWRVLRRRAGLLRRRLTADGRLGTDRTGVRRRAS